MRRAACVTSSRTSLRVPSRRVTSSWRKFGAPTQVLRFHWVGAPNLRQLLVTLLDGTRNEVRELVTQAARLIPEDEEVVGDKPYGTAVFHGSRNGQIALEVKERE